MSPTIFLHLQKSTSFAEDSSILQQIVELVNKIILYLCFLAHVLCDADLPDFDTMSACHVSMISYKIVVE